MHVHASPEQHQQYQCKRRAVTGDPHDEEFDQAACNDETGTFFATTIPQKKFVREKIDIPTKDVLRVPIIKQKSLLVIDIMTNGHASWSGAERPKRRHRAAEGLPFDVVDKNYMLGKSESLEMDVKLPLTSANGETEVNRLGRL